MGSWLVQPSLNTVSRNGRAIRIEPKILEVLVCLADHSQDTVSKEQIIRAVWGHTFVTDDVLTRSISELRRALEDDPKEPQFIATIPKKGYQLIAPVEAVGATEAMTRLRHRQWLVFAIAGALFLAATAVAFTRARPRPRLLHGTQLTNTQLVVPRNGGDLDSALLTDGSRLYFSNVITGSVTGQQLPVNGGEPVNIPTSLASFILFDASADGTELLVASVGGQDDMQLWALPTPGGSPRRIGDIRADGAGWSPDGKRIVYGKGSKLFVADRNGANSRLITDLACVECTVLWPRWSPDGQRVRFTREDYTNQTSTLWEVSPAGERPHPVLPDWTAHDNRKGSWTRDGKYFVFDDYENVWIREEERGLLGRGQSAPVQLTEGPLTMFSGVISPDSKKIFAVGERSQGEVLRYDAKTKKFERFLDGISAEGIDFSRDGQWMTYVAYPEGTLWRSRVNGGERLQLTSLPLKAVAPRWSPDGSRIAFTGQLAGKPVNIYTVNADGGDLQALADQEWRIAPSWSPDGRLLLFTAGAEGRELTLYDLRKRTSKVLSPGKVFNPVWSPDGRYILAGTPSPPHPPRLRLFDLKTAQWRDLNVGLPFPDAFAWSRDGKYIYLDFPEENYPSIQRLRVVDGRRENIADLSHIKRARGIFDVWFGLDPNDAPMILRDLSSQQIYAFHWEH